MKRAGRRWPFAKKRAGLWISPRWPPKIRGRDMAFKVRRIIVNASPVGHVWFDKRWKWHRPGIGMHVFKRKTTIADVLKYIANYYRVAVDKITWNDTQGRA